MEQIWMTLIRLDLASARSESSKTGLSLFQI